jgi:hypothetical protein
MPDMNQATNPTPVPETPETGLSLSELQAEVLSLRRERGSIVDPALDAADTRFDESPERRRVNELIDQVRVITPSGATAPMWLELDNAINALVFAAENWVLDRMVIGLWTGGGQPCVNQWRATRPTSLDPIEYAAELERREAEFMVAHGLTTTAQVTA